MPKSKTSLVRQSEKAEADRFKELRHENKELRARNVALQAIVDREFNDAMIAGMAMFYYEALRRRINRNARFWKVHMHREWHNLHSSVKVSYMRAFRDALLVTPDDNIKPEGI